MSKKIINPGQDVVAQQLEGFLAAYSRLYEPMSGMNVILRERRREGKVALVIGGGSGHEPLFSGFVGRGLADAAVCGNIFAAPNPAVICETAQRVDNGAGVLFLYGNYSGDKLNFDMAAELLEDEGVNCAQLRVWDDCASAPRERREDRRGIAGDIFALKIAGAACDAGLSLEEVLRVAEKARDAIGSIGLATSPGTIPGLERPTFALGEDEIEYGMGMHGEPGIERAKMQPADVLTDRMYAELKKDMGLRAGQEVCVLVNSLGSTTLLELGIVYRRLAQLLAADGIAVHDCDLNALCTCQEMGGFSISLMVLDEELRGYYDAPCSCPYYTKEDRR